MRRLAHPVLLDQAAVSGASFASTVLLVRALGLEGFGVFALIQMVLLFAVGVELALVAQPMSTYGPKFEGEDRRRYDGAVLTLQGMFALTLALVCIALGICAAAVWPSMGLGPVIAPATFAIVARATHALVRSGDFMRERPWSALVNDTIAYPGQFLALFLLDQRGLLTLANGLWAIGGAAGVASLLSIIRWPEHRAEPDDLWEVAGKHWEFGGWLSGMQVVQWFASNSYVLAAGALLGTAAVGAIKAAHSIAGLLHVPMLALENVLPPRAARRLSEDGLSATEAWLSDIARRGLGVTAAVTAGLALLSPLIVGLVYGAEATPETALALRALAVLYVFSFLITVLQIAFRTVERTRPVFVCYCLCTLFAVASAGPVVETFGFAGALAGMALQQALMGLLLLFTWRATAGGAQAVGVREMRKAR